MIYIDRANLARISRIGKTNGPGTPRTLGS